MKRPRPAAILAVALLVLIALAAGIEALVSSGASGPGAGGYAVVVVSEGEVVARLDLDDLERLGFVTIVADGEEQEGPTLLAVLDAAGITDFERVRIAGMGIRDDGDLALERADVTGDVVLDISRRGTVKVVSPAMTWEDRVRDVTEIVVE